MKLSEYQNLILSFLGDETQRRYGVTLINAAIKSALKSYQIFFPRRTNITAAIKSVDDKTILLSLPLEDSFELLSIQTDETATRLFPIIDFTEYRDGKTLTLYFSQNKPSLSAGNKIFLEINTPHTISGLDNAAQTSIPDGHFITVCEGAAGYAMKIRARSVLEVIGKRTEDITNLQAEGNRLVASYEENLNQLLNAQKGLTRMGQNLIYQNGGGRALPEGNFPI